MPTQKLATLESFYRGDTPLIRFELVGTDGTALDLSNYFKAFFTMTANDNPFTDADALFQKTVSPLSDPTTGILEFQLEKADTNEGDPARTYYWDLQLQDATFNRVFTILSGTFEFLTDYTRTS